MFLGIVSGLLLAASSSTAATAVVVQPPPDWHGVATAGDRARLRGWREALVKGVAAATAAGHADSVAREGALLLPDAALPDAALPAGVYRCRIVKLGVKAPRANGFIAYPPADCVVRAEGEVASLRKADGAQRPTGLLFADPDSRMVFLGTMTLGDERRAVDYGADPDRDMIGSVQRIGERRWRLVLPYPRFESIVDVIELVPAG
ncbi:DUF4893 domain-containing protein [Sphingomonas flavalba]|uniref:DUF4893 domain-containing protein n=1 Tax=Sphingomonas flavalba TaxID=2559804 RepID=UPI00109DFB87|nr:DUF4893 domain-containing protein [Sphingomonas flavalba]